MSNVPQPSEYEAFLSRRSRKVGELPATDERIESLDPERRAAIAQTWHRRAHEELKVATAFSVLCRELLETGAPADIVAMASRAVHDEVRHGEVCRSLASRYHGVELPWPPAVPIEPQPVREDLALRTALHVTGMCCVNEAVASTYLETSYAAATGPSARAALRELLIDEVEHARLGWIYVGRAVATPKLAHAIQANVLQLVQKVVGCWFDDTTITIPEGSPEDGLPSMAVTRATAITAMRDLVVPGFEQIGLDVHETREWIATLD